MCVIISPRACALGNTDTLSLSCSPKKALNQVKEEYKAVKAIVSELELFKATTRQAQKRECRANACKALLCFLLAQLQLPTPLFL